MELRPYQIEAVEAVIHDWQTHNDVLLVAATGSGKTIMFLEVLRRALQPGQRAMIVAHRKELIDQPKERIAAFFPALLPSVGVVMADQNECDKPIIIATVQSLSRRIADVLAHGPIHYLITDEAHHANAEQYRAFTDALRAAYPEMHHLGVTATPFRGDEDGMARVFTHVSARLGIDTMVKAGYLVRPRWLGFFTNIDLEGVGTQRGDFVAAQLAACYDTDEGRAIIVKAYQEHAAGRHALAFTASVAGAHALAYAFHQAGVTAVAIDGTTPKPVRERLIEQFKAGEIHVLCNCQVLTEGFDAPTANCVLMARPTRSDALYVQMMGRGLRPANRERAQPGETCLILDFMPKDTRNIVMAGDVLGVPREVIERVLATEERPGFTFDGEKAVSDGRPLEVVARELEYLHELELDALREQIRQWDSEGIARAKIASRIKGSFPYRLVLETLGRVKQGKHGKHHRKRPKYLGVFPIKNTRRWGAAFFGKEIGASYQTAEDAARAYNRAARAHFGDGAKLNDVPEDD